ncbi:MAG: response regulator [Rhodospirillales bacterium]|nr:response regulator [Rhodospirillales bacterium]
MKIARERVFIVDDDALVRHALSQVLEDDGYDTIVLENAEAAFALNQPIRTIFIDIFMPGMGGVEGIARILEQWPEAKIIAISGGWMGEGMKDALKAAKKAGAHSVLLKPFTNKELYEVLANLG